MAQHNRLGQAGEDRAVAYLQAKGYSILHRDWKAGRRDLDIVARSPQGMLTVVEVKTRRTGDYGDPSLAVTDAKIRSILLATEEYLHTFELEEDIRFDIIAIVGDKDNFSVEHIEDAFYPPLW